MTSNGPTTLTPRELEILKILCETGDADAIIAKQLFMATQTLKAHMSHMMRKLGVTNRTQMVLRGLGHVGNPVVSTPVTVITTICPSCGHDFAAAEMRT